MIDEFVGPWEAILDNSQYLLVSFFLSAAGLALFSGFIRAWLTRNEVGPRYRSAAISRLGATGIAFLSYAGIVAQSRLGYDQVGSLNDPDGFSYVPNGAAMDVFALRFLALSVALPLIATALITVCSLRGALSRGITTLAVFLTFSTTLSAYVGAFVLNRDDRVGIITWGVVSLVFLVSSTAVLVWAVRRSTSTLTAAATRLLRQSLTIFMIGLAIYPVVYFLEICTSGGAWATAIQVIFSLADVVLLVAVGEFIHRVAKLRTAEDVRAGIDVHPEAIWISSIKQSDAGRPAEVYLDAEATVHDRRRKPPTSSAVALDQYDVPEVASEDFLTEENQREDDQR